MGMGCDVRGVPDPSGGRVREVEKPKVEGVSSEPVGTGVAEFPEAATGAEEVPAADPGKSDGRLEGEGSGE